MSKKKKLVLLMFFLFFALFLLIPKKTYAKEPNLIIKNINEEIDVSLDNVYHYKVTMDVNIIKNIGEISYSIKTNRDKYEKKDTDPEFTISNIKCNHNYSLSQDYLYTILYINTYNLPKNETITISLEYTLTLKKDYYNRQIEKYFYLPIYYGERNKCKLYNKYA